MRGPNSDPGAIIIGIGQWSLREWVLSPTSVINNMSALSLGGKATASLDDRKEDSVLVYLVTRGILPTKSESRKQG